MEKLREELQVKLEKILHVYIFAQEAYLYTEYFHNPSTKEELDLVTNSAHSREIAVIMHLMFRTLISEISKLYSRSPNDKFRLNGFIDSLSSQGHFRKIGVSVTHIEHWRRKLEENKDTIENVLFLRSKLYAHTDNPLEDYSSVDISFKQIKSLLDIAGSILKEIYKDVFNTGLLIDSPTFDKERFTILKLLAKAEQERLEEIFSKYKKQR